MSSCINTAADCTVKMFKACLEGKYRVLALEGTTTDEELEQAFEIVYAQYVDLSGLFVTREFDLSAYIHYLDIRITVIKQFVALQRQFVSEFGEPCMSYFHLVKKYGHSLYWDHKNPNLQLFLEKLNKIEPKEVRYQIELKNKKNELFELHKKRLNQEHTPLESRKQFVTNIVRLQKAGFVINNDTSMEDVAIAVSDHREASETEKAQRNFNKRR